MMLKVQVFLFGNIPLLDTVARTEAAIIISHQRYDMHIHTLQVTNTYTPLQDVLL